MKGVTLSRLTMEAAEALLDLDARMDSPARARQQLEGAVALHNRLAEHRCAYLADEVGMGKTYVALAVLALMQHHHPRRRVLVIAPRENIQRKWEKDLRNLVRHSVRFADLRVKAADGRPAMPLVQCHSLLDLVQQTSLHSHGVFFVRMTSFSLGLGELRGDDSCGGKAARKMRDELRAHLPWLDAAALDLRIQDSSVFKEAFARCVCCALPVFDLVIVDEAHNLKHGLRTHSAARNRVLAAALGHALDSPPRDAFPGYGSRAAHVLMLSATPVEESYMQLWNQLQVLGRGGHFPQLRDPALDDEAKKDIARRFLIRRVTALELDGRRFTKNLYRREWRRGGVMEHDEPVRVTGTRERLVLALVQKKVAEIIGVPQFGASFQMGMLASFESFHETLASRGKIEPGTADENGPDESRFDGIEQTESLSERQGVDVGSINSLARSYRAQFNEELPHPKMDALRDGLKQNWNTGEKALVFVRRVASVRELKLKLEETYDDWLEQRLRSEFQGVPQVLSRVESLFHRYRRERAEHREQAGGILPNEEDDKSSAETFFAWFYRGEGPRGVLSGAALQRRLRQGTFFEHNHVAALLGCEAETTLATLAERLGKPESELSAELVGDARLRLDTKARKLPRQMVFEALQAVALDRLTLVDGPESEEARIILHELFAGMKPHAVTRAPEIPPDDARLLNRSTLFSELRRPSRAALRTALWPESDRKAGPQERFRTEALRAALLESALRLGHAGIDLHAIAVRQLGTLDAGAREDADEEQGLESRFLDLIEQQRLTPRQERAWAAFDELADIAAHFDLILDVNLPKREDMNLAEARRELARLLGNQQPVGGMAGKAKSQRLVSQFRMPGYPLVLVTTDVLQEGEDLHTFCSRIHHYGISWTSSGTEQRTGRIDRVRSQTERRLLTLQSAPEVARLQVHYPHLEDTIEVLQVRRLLQRMNTFLELMHEGLQAPQSEESRLKVSEEILRHHHPVPAVTTELQTAFDVQPGDLQGPVRTLARSPEQAVQMSRRFQDLRWRLDMALDLQMEAIEPGEAGKHRLFGTIFLPQADGSRRQQPFGLWLHSFEEHPLIRCISPVGRVCDEHELDEALLRHGLCGLRLGAVLTGRDDHSYDLTAEDEALLGKDGAHDLERVRQMILRVATQADHVERLLLELDQRLRVFHQDLKHE
ncbi:MAG: DEAD/DEAH box helicase family protein [Prosthecobacter sp.]|jgi:superfamily II DNA or RNA helicase|uniref:DEAD/DEAH box helicase family protein n=1 Tax=Prosthecobacter sp. TaxID=1965333 RepID=UPI0019E3A7B5|nr:DEAD/DEAH box helicase family protein [Prosthecobacter sp.]MBE2283837.1 DEAD/DEAH box helicase family protein [Prosthecobacter sp.]